MARNGARNGKRHDQPVLPAEEFQPTATEKLIRPYAEEYRNCLEKRMEWQSKEQAAMKRLSEVMAFHKLESANCGGGWKVLPEVSSKLKVVAPEAKTVKKPEDKDQTTIDQGAEDLICPLCEAPDYGECPCDKLEVYNKLKELGRVVRELDEVREAVAA